MRIGRGMSFSFGVPTHFFVSRKSYDKGVRSKGKGYIPFKMSKVRARVHGSLWNCQLGYGFPASANLIEV